eukprot:781226-Pleurochrysis_carterae.AAC.1
MEQGGARRSKQCTGSYHMQHRCDQWLSFERDHFTRDHDRGKRHRLLWRSTRASPGDITSIGKRPTGRAKLRRSRRACSLLLRLRHPARGAADCISVLAAYDSNLAAWLPGCLVVWLPACFSCFLCLHGCLPAWLVGWLAGWLAGWL